MNAPVLTLSRTNTFDKLAFNFAGLGRLVRFFGAKSSSFTLGHVAPFSY